MSQVMIPVWGAMSPGTSQMQVRVAKISVIEVVVATKAHFFRGMILMRRDIISGGTLWPKRLSSGRAPRIQARAHLGVPRAFSNESSTAGMMLLSVLKIQPVRIRTL